jgi:hypothetical protein
MARRHQITDVALGGDAGLALGQAWVAWRDAISDQNGAVAQVEYAQEAI